MEDGALELLVKVFPEQPGQDYATARDLAGAPGAIRRAGGVPAGCGWPYRHPGEQRWGSQAAAVKTPGAARTTLRGAPSGELSGVGADGRGRP